MAAIGLLGGRYLVKHVPLWLGRITYPVSKAMGTHPLLAKWMHVLINAVPDVAYALLTLAGLAYLMPEVTAKLESRRPVRIFLFALFALMGLSAILVNAVNRTDQEDRDRTQSTKQTEVLGSVLDIQKTLHSNKTLTEVQRKEALFESLRDEYIITHNPIDPDILAKTKMPPDDWMNMRLAALGEHVRVAESKPITPIIQEAPKPELAKLVFTLWDENASLERPTLSQTISPDADGNYPVDFSFGDLSETTAEGVDFWIEVCTVCSFAKEPDGFEKPVGSSELVRDRTIATVNPGTNVPKMRILVKAPPSPSFVVGFHYSCKTCGKMIPHQLATIYEQNYYSPPMVLMPPPQ
jgi:hypothetical protein